nr:protein PRY1 isoform X2 [Drosophila kikkawai]
MAHKRPQQIPKTHERAVGPRGVDTKANNELFLKEVLNASNKFRAMHGCPALTVNPELNKLAQEWANHLRDNNIMQHRPNPKYGENIFLSGGMDVAGDLPVEMWYREMSSYDFNKAEFVAKSGHFTQLIWKASKEMGAGVARKADKTWVVCNYNPAGNIVGNFKDNVPRKIEQAAGPRGADTNANNEVFLKDVLNTTNKLRAMHGCPALTVNAELNKLAQEWANHLRDKNIMQHRPNPKYGENIFLSGGMDVEGELPVNMWYREINSYNFDKAEFVPTAGHFTQLIWKASKER